MSTPPRTMRIVRELPVLRCTAGVTPCGATPARPYLCGDRCDTHSPGAVRARLDAEQRHQTQGPMPQVGEAA